jgi:hypothetical protein
MSVTRRALPRLTTVALARSATLSIPTLAIAQPTARDSALLAAVRHERRHGERLDRRGDRREDRGEELVDAGKPKAGHRLEQRGERKIRRAR